MNTVTHPAPAVEKTAERITLREAMHLILAATDLPDALGIRQNRKDSDILAVQFATIDDLAAWMPFFGLTGEPERCTNDKMPGVVYAVEGAFGWHGWYVSLSASETAEVDR